MANVVGVIERVARKKTDKGYQTGLVLNGTWYNINSQEAFQVETGDKAAISYEEVVKNGKKYVNIIKYQIQQSEENKAKVAEKKSYSGNRGGSKGNYGGGNKDSGYAEREAARQASIQRQNALGNAVTVVTSTDLKGSTDAEIAARVLGLAETFLNWVEQSEGAPAAAPAPAPAAKTKAAPKKKEVEVEEPPFDVDEGSVNLDDDEVDLASLLADA